MMRLATFIIALLLLAGSADPTRSWLIALVVVSGLAAMHWQAWRPLRLQPALDLRLGAFVLAVLLLAGVIDPTRGWLIATTVVAGLAMASPRLVGLDAHEHPGWRIRGTRSFRREWRAWDARWDGDWDGEDWR